MNANRTRLGLETLEARALMSITPIPDPTGGVVSFNGTSDSEYLEIEDTGRIGAGQVRYRTAANGAWTTLGYEVWRININTGEGNDKVIHAMAGNLSYGLYREVNAYLGTGDDSFASLVLGNVTGPDNRYGLHVLADGQEGSDHLVGEMHGDILGAGDLAFSLYGGAGNFVDTLTVNLSRDVDIATGARFWSNLYGGSGNDRIALTYQGELDGLMLFTLSGQAGSDNVSARATIDKGSTGFLGGPHFDQQTGTYPDRAVVDGGTGNDTVKFYVDAFENASSDTHVAGVLRGGEGTDFFEYTPRWITDLDQVYGETAWRW